MNIILELQNKDNSRAYAVFKEVLERSKETDEYYSYFDDFVGLLSDMSSYVRTRGFILACAQAQWDEDNKFEANLDELLKMLHDEKPITVRQCVQALQGVVLAKPNLANEISRELSIMDLSKYKQDTMVPLIKRDINDLLKVIEKVTK